MPRKLKQSSPESFSARTQGTYTHRNNCSSWTTNTHPFNGLLSGTTRWVSRHQKGKTNLDFTEARDSGTVSGSGISWAICMSSPRSRQITTPAPHHSVFLQAGCPSCRPTNGVRALKASGPLISIIDKKKN